MHFKFIVFFILVNLSIDYSIAQSNEKPVFSIFLIGDAGYHTSPDTTLRKLQSELLSEQYQEKSAVIFLGDNVYPGGLIPTNRKKGKEKNGIGELKCFNMVNKTTSDSNAAKLNSQFTGLENYRGKIFMIPGNHDWQKGQKHGQEILNNERDSVNSYFNSGKYKYGGFYPKKSFGPEDQLISAGKNVKIRLIFLDTQWWLHTHHHKTDNLLKTCWKEKEKVLDSCLKQLSQTITNAKLNNEYVIIAAHHPVFTFGQHGKHAKFNATLIAARMYNQNIGSKRYNQLRNALDSICAQYSADKLIYAAGHDHNLQYFELANYINIVSGAGSKTTTMNPEKVYSPARFEEINGLKNMYGEFNTNGYFRIDYFEDSKIRIRVWEKKSNEINPDEMKFKYFK